MKAGAKLCYLSLTFMLISAFGMFISQFIEDRFEGCSRGEFAVCHMIDDVMFRSIMKLV